MCPCSSKEFTHYAQHARGTIEVALRRRYCKAFGNAAGLAVEFPELTDRPDFATGNPVQDRFDDPRDVEETDPPAEERRDGDLVQIGRASWRERVWQYV